MIIPKIVFDFDGTLVNTNTLKRDSFFKIASSDHGGIDAMARVLDNCDFCDRYKIWKKYSTILGQDNDFAFNKAQLYTDLLENEINRDLIFNYSEDLLKFLIDKSAKLFICSATPYNTLIKLVDKLGWTKFFTGIYGYPETKTEIIERHIVSDLIKKSKVAYIGDGWDDYIASKKFDIKFFPIDGGSYKKKSIDTNDLLYETEKANELLKKNLYDFLY